MDYRRESLQSRLDYKQHEASSTRLIMYQGVGATAITGTASALGIYETFTGSPVKGIALTVVMGWLSFISAKGSAAMRRNRSEILDEVTTLEHKINSLDNIER